VPPAALRGLAVNLSRCGREKNREGEWNFDWKAVIGNDDDDAEEWDRFEALEGPVPTHVSFFSERSRGLQRGASRRGLAPEAAARHSKRTAVVQMSKVVEQSSVTKVASKLSQAVYYTRMHH